MKECLSSGSYLHQKHLLYRSTINKKVTSEQNINMAAAETAQRAALLDRIMDNGHLMVINLSFQYVQMFRHNRGLCGLHFLYMSAYLDTGRTGLWIN